jgi:cytochrome c biogenesis protein CcmG/thiol:disulfide interchange protein DsbE
VAAAVLSRGGSSDTGPVTVAQAFNLPPVLPGAPNATLAAAPGRPTIVTFFAAWCDPCRAELPLLEAAAHAAGGPTVVGVDVLDQRPEAQMLVRQVGVTFPAGFDHDGTASQRWGVVGLPVNVFVAPDGRIVAYHDGELDAHQLSSFIHRLDAADR